MKPSRIAILIWCAIALLGVMCVVLPERMQIGELTLRWTTLNKVLGAEEQGTRSQDERYNSFVSENSKMSVSTAGETPASPEASPSSLNLDSVSNESKPNTSRSTVNIPTVEEVQSDSDGQDQLKLPDRHVLFVRSHQAKNLTHFDLSSLNIKHQSSN